MRCKEASLLLLVQGEEFATFGEPPRLARPAKRGGAYPLLCSCAPHFGADDASDPGRTSSFWRHNGRVLHHGVDKVAGVNVDQG